MTLNKTTLVGLTLFASLAQAADSAPPLSHDEVKHTVDSHLGDVKSCMKQHGAATGKLVVEFAIQPDGKVTDSKPKERSSNKGLDSCIAGAFGRWTFPKPRGGAIMAVVYPFTFAAPPKPPAQGKLEESQILSTVNANMKDVKGCYDVAVKEKSDVAGTVKVAMVISPEGKVTEAKVFETHTGSVKLDSCVVDKVKAWIFPKPQGGEAAVLYPFWFVHQ